VDTPVRRKVLVAACWLVVVIAVFGPFLSPAGETDPSEHCVELCADWWHPLATGGFALVFAVSAIINVALLMVKLAGAIHPRVLTRVAVAAGVDLLAAVLWAGGVLLGPEFQLVESIAGALVAGAGTALLVVVIWIRRHEPVPDA
jgi:hypothetical protein